MRLVLGLMFKFMPLLFGLGFVAPLIAQTLPLLGWTSSGAIPPLWIGLAVGVAWGGFATWKGRWV